MPRSPRPTAHRGSNQHDRLATAPMAGGPAAQRRAFGAAPFVSGLLDGTDSSPVARELAALAALASPDVGYVHVPRRLDDELSHVARTITEAASQHRAAADPGRQHLCLFEAQVEHEGDLAEVATRAALPRALRKDLSALTKGFFEPARGFGIQRCVAHLFVTWGDDCRKFHVDYYAMRLVTSYFGSGTEVAPDGLVRRGELARTDADLEEVNRAIVPSMARGPGEDGIVRAGPGDVVVLKGDRAPDRLGRGVVHRSPPIAEAGGVRLVFKLTASGSRRPRAPSSRG